MQAVLSMDSPWTYRIAKVVKIRDKTLGLYYGLTSTLIFVYIVIWCLGVNKVCSRPATYQSKADPKPSMIPEVEPCNLRVQSMMPQSYLEYEPAAGSIKLDLVGSTPKINVAQEEYCKDMRCRLCDEHDVRYPNTDTREPLVTTYVREARQRRVCHRNATECPFASPFQTVLWDDYLVAGVQRFQLRVTHAVWGPSTVSFVLYAQVLSPYQVQAPMFYFQTRSSEFNALSQRMEGQLVQKTEDGEIKTIKTFPANGQADKMSIGKILKAANVDLDKVMPGHIRPIRETGIVVYCHIRYYNDYTFFAPAPKIRYEYEFTSSTEVEAVYEPVHLGVAWTSPVDVEERMMLTRRGIKLVWTQEGALGRFSFEALMVTIAVGLALVHLVHIIGDFIAKGLLPQRKAYKEATEEDFGENRSTGMEETNMGWGYGAIPSGEMRP